MLRAVATRRWILGVMALLHLSTITYSVAAPSFADALTNGTINISGLAEASGVAASRNNDNVLWVHNDSGNPAVVYAIDTQGRYLGKYNLPGNIDNEDIAIGPGPVANVSYLYVGDIGDNSANRSGSSAIRVYQIPEPLVYTTQFTNPVTRTPKGSRTVFLSYPDGPRNAESMFVDPVTGDLFILTKESTSRVYTATKAQMDANSSNVLTFVRSLSFTTPSGADISAAGNEIVVRRESFAQLWKRTSGQTISSALGGAATTIPVTGIANGEPNGEGIGFDAAGRGYFTVSDNASTQPVRYFARTSSDGPPVQQALVQAGSTWSFLDNGTDQGTAWRDPLFNDSAWSTGIAQFGYGEGDEKTIMHSNRSSIYFRKDFNVSEAASITNLVLKLLVDDGAAVFLNGAPICYYHLASNAVYSTLATQQPVNLQDTWLSFPVATSNLTNGVNTLAVEVHQASLTSSNLSFDLQLVATCNQTNAPGLTIAPVGNAMKIYWPASAAGYVLEENGGLNAGSAWNLSTAQSYIWSDQFLVTNSSPLGTRFYRLHHP
jgi:hypothetical protein